MQHRIQIAAAILVCIALPLLKAAAVDDAPTISFVTRAEATMILLTSLGVPIPEPTTAYKYADVIENAWYAPYLVAAIERGMIDQPTHGLAYPHRPVTRAEFLKMLTVAFNLSTGLAYDYTDISSEDWYAPYAGNAQRYTLFPNLTEGTLQPNALLTHDEVTEALRRVLRQHPTIRHVPRQSYLSTLQDTLPSLRQSAFAPVLLPQTTVAGVQGKREPQYVTAKMVKQAMLGVMQNNPIAQVTKMELIDMVNAERRANGLQPLQENPLLSRAAEKHAEDMWKQRYFGHTTPDGKTYVDRIESAGYLTPYTGACDCSIPCSCEPYYALGENIAKGQMTIEQVFADWMDSPSHRRNILQPEFTEIGVGLFGTLWVQTFGNVGFKPVYL